MNAFIDEFVKLAGELPLALKNEGLLRRTFATVFPFTKKNKAMKAIIGQAAERQAAGSRLSTDQILKATKPEREAAQAAREKALMDQAKSKINAGKSNWGEKNPPLVSWASKHKVGLGVAGGLVGGSYVVSKATDPGPQLPVANEPVVISQV